MVKMTISRNYWQALSSNKLFYAQLKYKKCGMIYLSPTLRMKTFPCTCW